MKFSVLISVYSQESPQNLLEAFNSLIDQTLQPDEIILVVDGPIGEELEVAIDKLKMRLSKKMSVIRLEENQGLGNALKVGLNHCSFDIVARMDTDDISVISRFEKQIGFIIDNPQYAVVGSNIAEFKKIPGDINIYKKMPEKNEELIRYAKYRNPLNHPSIAFRKQAVLDCGGYNEDFKFFEDYSLFIRMIQKGYRFYNIQENLLCFRVGDGLASIRKKSGVHYIKKEISFLMYAYRIDYLNEFEFIRSVCIRIGIRLFPRKVIIWFYRKFLRHGS